MVRNVFCTSLVLCLRTNAEKEKKRGQHFLTDIKYFHKNMFIWTLKEELVEYSCEHYGLSSGEEFWDKVD